MTIQREGNSTDRLHNPEILVSEGTRNSLRDLKIENFPGGACPQTPPRLRKSTASIVVLASEKKLKYYHSSHPLGLAIVMFAPLPPLDENPK